MRRQKYHYQIITAGAGGPVEGGELPGVLKKFSIFQRMVTGSE